MSRHNAQVSQLPEEPGAAFLSICGELENCLRSRAEVIVFNALQHCPVPKKYIRVLLTELGFRVIPRDASGISLITDYVTVLRAELGTDRSTAGEGCQHISRREQTYLGVRSGIRRVVISGKAGAGIRKHVLKLLTRSADMLLTTIPETGEWHALQSVLLGAIFAEPELVMRDLLHRHSFFSAYFYSKRLGHLAGNQQSSRHVRQFVWHEEQNYRALLGHGSDSRVLVTIHMGDFTGALKRISMHALRGRTVTSLKREDDTDQVRNLFVPDPDAHEVVRHGTDNPIRIVSALRRGNHTLMALFDLREDFGRTTEVTFFGRPARFVRGPAQLAIMGRAAILPFVTYESGSQSLIEMAPLIDPAPLAGETLQDAGNRITRQLVALAERWIRRSPEQWKYLNNTAAYFATDVSNEK